MDSALSNKVAVSRPKCLGNAKGMGGCFWVSLFDSCAKLAAVTALMLAAACVSEHPFACAPQLPSYLGDTDD